jgi:uncharacterized coiled-coil protein SlyX
MADAATPQDSGLSSLEKHSTVPRLVSKTVKALRTALAGVGEQEKAFEALERALGETKRENEDAKQRIEQLEQKLRTAEDNVQSAVLTRCDLAAALLQRFTCSGDLDLLISTLTEAPPTAEKSDADVLNTFEKPLLVVHRLEPPNLSCTIAAATAAAVGNSVEPVAAAAAVEIEAPTPSPPKVKPRVEKKLNPDALKDKKTFVNVESDAEIEDQQRVTTTRKRRRDSESEEGDTVSVRTWFRGSGVRTRKSSRSSKKIF